MQLSQALPSKNIFEYTCTTLQHPDCKDGQRLLDAYLRALGNVDAIHGSNPAYNAGTVQYVCDELIAARRRYWTHVSKHKCRKPRDSALSSHGVLK
jgi:hypothetical protein